MWLTGTSLYPLHALSPLRMDIWLIKVLYTRMILFALPIECPLILNIYNVILIEKVLINNLTFGK